MIGRKGCTASQQRPYAKLPWHELREWAAAGAGGRGRREAAAAQRQQAAGPRARLVLEARRVLLAHRRLRVRRKGGGGGRPVGFWRAHFVGLPCSGGGRPAAAPGGGARRRRAAAQRASVRPRPHRVMREEGVAVVAVVARHGRCGARRAWGARGISGGAPCVTAVGAGRESACGQGGAPGRSARRCSAVLGSDAARSDGQREVAARRQAAPPVCRRWPAQAAPPPGDSGGARPIGRTRGGEGRCLRVRPCGDRQGRGAGAAAARARASGACSLLARSLAPSLPAAEPRGGWGRQPHREGWRRIRC